MSLAEDDPCKLTVKSDGHVVSAVIVGSNSCGSGTIPFRHFLHQGPASMVFVTFKDAQNDQI